MGIINLEDIKHGMVLAKDLKDRSGLVLLGAGNEITEKHLRILKMWGITEADIEGVTREEAQPNTTSEIDTFLFQEAEIRLREQFYHTDLKHPFIQELFRLLTFQRVLDKSGEGDNAP